MPTIDPEEGELQRASRQVADRLRARGVLVLGDESADELASLLEAVERFEIIVEQRGGDLMVDEPVGNSELTAPDHPAFVLPRRRDDETAGRYIARISEAAARARERR